MHYLAAGLMLHLGQREKGLAYADKALAMQPKLLVADEATSMLDASLRVNILNVLTDLRNDLGMTILFITHSADEAIYLADPDDNGIELYRDRPRAEWPRDANGQLEMTLKPLDVAALLREAD